MALTRRDKAEIDTLIKNQCTEASEISELLLHAPKAACILEVLTVLAACTGDPSLRSGAADEKFDYLKFPDSFKASLCQVINEMRDAFQTGHNCITKMQMNLEDMPTSIKSILKSLDNHDPNSKELIDDALANIKSVFDKCVEALNDATDGATHALEVIRELFRAARATQGRMKNRDKEVEAEQQELERILKQRKADLKKLEEEIQEQNKIAEEAMQDYKVEQNSGLEDTLKLVGGLCSAGGSMASLASPSVPAFLGSMATVSNVVEEAVKMNRQQNNRKSAWSRMKESQEYAEKLRKEREEAEEKVNETINALKRLNLEGIDLKDVLKYLQEGVKQLTEFQAAWEHVKQFLEGVQMIVDNSLVENVDGFTEWVISNMEKEEVSALIRKAVRKEAMAAFVVGSVLYNTATLYKEISSKYVLPSCERALISMDLPQDQAKILQYLICSKFIEIKYAVKEAIENHNSHLPKVVEEALKKEGFQLD